MDQTPGPGMAVLIPTCNNNQLLDRTLGAVAKGVLPDPARVIVVENGGENGAREVVEARQDSLPVEYRYVEWGNKSNALNKALEELTDELVVFLDDDVRFGPDLFQEYARRSAVHGPGTFFGGPVDCDYEKAVPEWLQEFLPGSVTGWTLGSEEKEIQDPLFLGFNWAAFTNDLKSAGGFDPNFGPGSPIGSTGQETDMQLRLLAKGARARFLPGARVWHYVRAVQADPSWCLRRRYRSGIANALSERGNVGASVFGKPGWAVKKLVLERLKVIPASFLRDPAKRFRPRAELALIRGYLHGWGIAKEVQLLRDTSSRAPEVRADESV